MREPPLSSPLHPAHTAGYYPATYKPNSQGSSPARRWPFSRFRGSLGLYLRQTPCADGTRKCLPQGQLVIDASGCPTLHGPRVSRCSQTSEVPSESDSRFRFAIAGSSYAASSHPCGVVHLPPALESVLLSRHEKHVPIPTGRNRRAPPSAGLLRSTGFCLEHLSRNSQRSNIRYGCPPPPYGRLHETTQWTGGARC